MYGIDTAPSNALRRERYRRAVVAGIILLISLAPIVRYQTRSSYAAVNGQLNAAAAVELGAYFLAGIAIGFWYRRRRATGWLDPRRWMWIWVATVIISSIYSPVLLVALAKAVGLLLAAALVTQLSERPLSDYGHRIVWLGLVSGASILTVILVVAPQGVSGRSSALAIHPGVLSTILAACLIFVLASWKSMDSHPSVKAARVTRLVAIALLAAGLILTNTRSTFVGLALVYMTWLLITPAAQRRAHARRFAVLWSVAAVAMVAIVPGEVVSFFSRGDSASQLLTFSGRTELATGSIEIIKQSPIFGHGFLATRVVLRDIVVGGGSLGGGHNILIELLTNSGVVGTGVMISFLFVVLAQLIRSLRIRQRSPRQNWTMTYLLLVVFFVVTSAISGSLAQGLTPTTLILFLAAAWSSSMSEDGVQLLGGGGSTDTAALPAAIGSSISRRNSVV